MKTFAKIIVTVLFIFLVSCNNDDDFIKQGNERTFGIRHDLTLADYENLALPADASRPNFSAVVAFHYSLDASLEKDYVASGVLIKKNWILTAAHNFYDKEEQQAPALISGIQVLVGNDPNQPQAVYSVEKLVIHPTWLAGKQELQDANDLCLVKLSASVNQTMPASLYSNSDEKVGNVVWHCGFGDYSQKAGQNPEKLSKKHAMENILDRVKAGFTSSTQDTNYYGGLLAFDFDNPEGTINALGDNLVNEDEALLGTGSSSTNALTFEGTTIEGDSGGPLFLYNKNEWQVAGILSGGAYEPIENHKDGDYGDISIYTRVSTAMDWISSVLE